MRLKNRLGGALIYTILFPKSEDLRTDAPELAEHFSVLIRSVQVCHLVKRSMTLTNC